MQSSTYDGEYKRHKMGKLPGRIPWWMIVHMREKHRDPRDGRPINLWVIVRQAHKRQRRRNRREAEAGVDAHRRRSEVRLRGLAYRRHHRQRIRDRARRIFKTHSRYGWNGYREYKEWLDRSVQRLAENMAHCNVCCGNRRKWEPLTMQERRAPELTPLDDGDK